MKRTHPEGIRAFIALDLSNQARDTLEKIQQSVRRRTGPDSVRWVGRQAFHLTLFFLGDGNGPDAIAALSDGLDPLAAGHRPLALQLGALGCFPNPRSPRVLWVGVEGDLQPLQRLKAAVDDLAAGLGWEPEKRPYHPHLTLGRVKDPYGVVNHDLPYGQPLESAAWTVDALHLYHSQLGRQGARYIKIHSAALGGPPPS